MTATSINSDTAAPRDEVVDLDDELELVVGTSLEPFVDPSERAERRGRRAVTDAASQCITRFAALEADVSTDELDGLGRVSSVRFPRLGGVLHGRVAVGGRAAALLTMGAERTIRAGYHAALATHQVADTPVEHADVEDLWDAFLPASYRIPRNVAATAWEVCRFDEFWVDLLVELGLAGDANRFARGHVSPLSRSIRGVSTVGVALALTERGGRYDRLVSGRQAPRGSRRQGRDLPPAPRILPDDAD